MVRMLLSGWWRCVRGAFPLGVAAIAMVSWGNPSGAVEPPERYGDIPSDSIAVATVDLKVLRGSPTTEMIPWEIADVACQEQFGFSLNLIDSLDVTVGMPSPMPEVGVSIRFNEDVDIAELTDELAGPVQTAPKDSSLRFRDLTEAPMVRVAQKESRRVLVGTEGTLRRMMSQRIQTGGPTVQLLQSSDAPVRIAFNFAKVRDIAMGAFEQAAPAVPEPMQEDIADMLALIENFLVEFRATTSQALQVSVGTSSGPNADALSDCMNRLRSEGVRLMKENIEAEVNRDESLSDAMRGAISTYSQRMQDLMENERLWSVKGDRVVLEIENSIMSNYGTIGVMTGLLLPAVQAAREAARRMSSSNNLKQIMLSLLNYESAYSSIPGRIVKSKDGKPLLSWRVLMLPFLEETELYNEFRMDEPWDSEHNLRLLDRMPAVYANPRVATLPGHTVYLAPFGENVGWPEDKFRYSQITDGTSNTIAVAEVSAELAVPWTKPDDFDIDFYKDGSWMPPGPGGHVAMFDGSVIFLSRTIDWDGLRAMFTMNGSDEVKWGAIAP
jgi:hypothetical protein